MTIGIGSTVWIFDENRRVYRRDAEGRAIGRPIYREHFRPLRIVDATPRSWILETGPKIPKSGGGVREVNVRPYGKRRVFMTEEAVNDAVWIAHHGASLGEAVRMCADADVLRKVAALVGYDPEKRP